MLNERIEKAHNEQINAEMWSAYLYLSMAAYCHKTGQPGMAKWFEVQFKEEQDHAKILFNYIVQRNGVVSLKPIDAVPTEWKSTLDVFESTLAHEQKVTSLINNLLDSIRNLFSLSQEFIKSNSTNSISHSSLSKLTNSIMEVFNLKNSFSSIKNFIIYNCINTN